MPKIVITILLLTAVSLTGCFRLPAVENQNTNTATSTAEEIDTSDWKTYRNEEFGFEFRYPESMSFIGDTFFSNDYDEDASPAVPEQKYIADGFRLEVLIEELPANTSLAEWVGRPGGVIGKTVYREKFNKPGTTFIEKDSTGYGFADEWPVKLRYITRTFLLGTESGAVTLKFYAQDQDVEPLEIYDAITDTLLIN